MDTADAPQHARKSFICLNPVLPDRAFCAPTTPSRSFSPYTFAVPGIFSHRALIFFSLFYKTKLRHHSPWKLCVTILPLWPPDWIRHLFSMLISTTPLTKVYFIVWLSIFSTTWLSFFRARALPYFFSLFSYSLYQEQSLRYIRHVKNDWWMNNRLQII